MNYTQKLSKIGNSVGIIIPKPLLKHLGLDAGSEIYIDVINDKAILSTKKTKSISPEFLRIAEKTGEKYSEAFKELAK